jgi:hypothetical protein
MATCKTCAHWTEEAPYNQPEQYVIRECGCRKLQEAFYHHEMDSLCYSYQEGGGFYTGPDFGCVHHLEKNNGNA